jgi:hypothetical protein
MNNDNRGSISKNKRKEQDKHPDYRGSATIEGKQYWISAWIKQKDGESFLSMNYQVKEEQASKPQQAKSKSSNDDDDMPF